MEAEWENNADQTDNFHHRDCFVTTRLIATILTSQKHENVRRQPARKIPHNCRIYIYIYTVRWRIETTGLPYFKHVYCYLGPVVSSALRKGWRVWLNGLNGPTTAWRIRHWDRSPAERCGLETQHPVDHRKSFHPPVSQSMLISRDNYQAIKRYRPYTHAHLCSHFCHASAKRDSALY